MLFEVYHGEVFESGSADFDVVDDALAWVTAVETDETTARTAAFVQKELHNSGTALAPRDAFTAGTAAAFNETLAIPDDDFDVLGLTEALDVDLL
ncbi:MAG: VapC toxin family PIN domain ribonuclease [Halolamina sp.]